MSLPPHTFTAPPGDDDGWETRAGRWAAQAVLRARALDICWPNLHGALPASADELRATVAGAAPHCDARRASVAVLCGYIHAVASRLHRSLIPEYEADAHAHALGLDHAVLQVLATLGGDYGSLETET